MLVGKYKKVVNENVRNYKESYLVNNPRLKLNDAHVLQDRDHNLQQENRCPTIFTDNTIKELQREAAWSNGYHLELRRGRSAVQISLPPFQSFFGIQTFREVSRR